MVSIESIPDFILLKFNEGSDEEPAMKHAVYSFLPLKRLVACASLIHVFLSYSQLICSGSLASGSFIHPKDIVEQEPQT